MTTKTFTSSINHRDRDLVCFQADDNAALLKAICSNSATGYVRQLRDGGPVSVPARKAAAVTAHLVKRGWAAK